MMARRSARGHRLPCLCRCLLSLTPLLALLLLALLLGLVLVLVLMLVLACAMVPPTAQCCPPRPWQSACSCPACTCSARRCRPCGCSDCTRWAAPTRVCLKGMRLTGALLALLALAVLVLVLVVPVLLRLLPRSLLPLLRLRQQRPALIPQRRGCRHWAGRGQTGRGAAPRSADC